MHAHVFIFSASLCLLVGAFTFIIIIDMYGPITIFLIVLSLFGVDPFLLLGFLPRKVLLAFLFFFLLAFLKLVW